MPSTTDRPIALLHGCGGSFTSTFVKPGWLREIAASQRTAVGIDLPGHGTTRASRDPADYADLAALAARKLPKRCFDGIGFSLGAKLLVELAVRFPGRVGRLVLGGIGDNVFAPEQVAEAAALALEAGPTSDTSPAVKAFLRTWEPTRNDPLAVAAVLRRPPNPIFTPEKLQKVTSPVLVVNGALDPINTLGDRFLSCLTDVRYLTLAGVGHFDLPKQKSFIRAAIKFVNLESLARGREMQV